MEDEEKKDNNTLKDGLKKGALGFVKAIFDYIKGIVALLLKFEKYTKYKIFIFIALTVIAVLLFMLAGYRMSN